MKNCKSPKEQAKEQAEVMLHFWNGGEVEYAYRTSANKNWKKVYEPLWDWCCYIYRVAEQGDPYAALKAAAKDPTKQIRCYPFAEDDSDWINSDKGDGWTWYHSPDQYQIRDKPNPAKVKFLAYATNFTLFWVQSNIEADCQWKRVPSEDKEVEVEE